MKKPYVLFALMFVTASLFPDSSEPSACNHTKKAMISTVIKGVWNFMKIGTGIASFCGGAYISMRPCKAGFRIKSATWFMPENKWGSRALNIWGNCCIGFGILLASPFFYFGYKTVRNGFHGLHKLCKKKSCIYCEYNHRELEHNNEELPYNKNRMKPQHPFLFPY